MSGRQYNLHTIGMFTLISCDWFTRLNVIKSIASFSLVLEKQNSMYQAILHLIHAVQG